MMDFAAQGNDCVQECLGDQLFVPIDSPGQIERRKKSCIMLYLDLLGCQNTRTNIDYISLALQLELGRFFVESRRLCVTTNGSCAGSFNTASRSASVHCFAIWVLAKKYQ